MIDVALGVSHMSWPFESSSCLRRELLLVWSISLCSAWITSVTSGIFRKVLRLSLVVGAVMSGDQSFDEEEEEEEEEDMRTAVKRGAPAAAKPSVSMFTYWWARGMCVHGVSLPSVLTCLCVFGVFFATIRKRWRWKRRVKMTRKTMTTSECTCCELVLVW